MADKASNQLIQRKFFDVGFILLLLYTFSLFILSYQEGLGIFSKLIGGMLFAFLLVAVFRREVTIRIPVEFVFAFIWFLWALISSIFASDIELALTKVFTLIQVLGLSAAVCLIIVRQRTTTPFWVGVIIAALIASVITLNNVDAYVEPNGRISGTVGNANLFAVVLISAMVASFSYATTVRSRLLKLVLFLIAVFFFYMTAETGSRKGMIGSMLAIVTLMLIILQRTRKRNFPQFVLACLGGLILLIGGGVYLKSSTFADRLDRVAVAAPISELSRADTSIEKRVEFIRLALEQSSKRPLVGFGLDNYRNIDISLFQTIGTYSHSNYIEILVSTGIPGLLLYCSIYIALIVRLFYFRSAAYSDDTVGPFAISATLGLIMITFDVAMVSYYEKIWWFLLSGVIAQLEILRQNAKLARRLM